MADFKTHLAASTVLGVGYGGAASVMYGVPLPTCVLAAGLCSVSGMLPDIDSGPGRPLREITTFMAAVVPAMLFRRLMHMGMSHESIVLLGAGLYVGIRFGLAWFLKHYTVHRGMFHSFVAAAIFGELAFLLAYTDDTAVSCFIAGGVVLGYLSHLVLDEVYSVQWNGVPRLKSSFGTAMKFFADGWWPNISAYAKFAVLTFLVIQEPTFMRQWNVRQMRQMVNKLAEEIPESLRSLAPARPAANPAEKSAAPSPQPRPAPSAKVQSADQPPPPSSQPKAEDPLPVPSAPLGWPPAQAAEQTDGRVRR